jgi:hypothetical protein
MFDSLGQRIDTVKRAIFENKRIQAAERKARRNEEQAVRVEFDLIIERLQTETPFTSFLPIEMREAAVAVEDLNLPENAQFKRYFIAWCRQINTEALALIAAKVAEATANREARENGTGMMSGFDDDNSIANGFDAVDGAYDQLLGGDL